MQVYIQMQYSCITQICCSPKVELLKPFTDVLVFLSPLCKRETKTWSSALPCSDDLATQGQGTCPVRLQTFRGWKYPHNHYSLPWTPPESTGRAGWTQDGSSVLEPHQAKIFLVNLPSTTSWKIHIPFAPKGREHFTPGALCFHLK